MILPAVRERLDAVLRQPAVEGALAALRGGANQVAFSGLHDVAKALVAAYATHALRRPAFFITSSNRRAETFAETLRFFSNVFPGRTGAASGLAGEVATLLGVRYVAVGIAEPAPGHSGTARGHAVSAS